MKTQQLKIVMMFLGTIMMFFIFSSCEVLTLSPYDDDPISMETYLKLYSEAQVNTDAVSEVLSTSAIVRGEILDLGSGITDFGHCWCINVNPTTSECKTSYGVTGRTGIYESQLSNLQPGQLYHVRAYVRSGDKISFGEDVTFTTLESK